MWVANYLLLGFFDGPAEPAQTGTGGARRIPRRADRQAPGQGYGFLPEDQAVQRARTRRRQQDDFLTLHLLTH